MSRRRNRKPRTPKPAPKAADGFDLDPNNPGGGARGTGRGLGVVVDALRGLGQETASTYFAPPRVLTFGEICALLTQGLPKRIVDMLPEEAFASGYRLDPGELRPDMERAALAAGFATFEDAEAAEAQLAERLDVDGAIRRTWQKARGYGDAIGVVGYPSDDNPPTRSSYAARAPFGERPISWLRSWDRRDFRPLDPEKNANLANYGEPDRYEIYNTRPANPRDEPLPGLGVVGASRVFRLSTDDGLSILQRGILALSALMGGASSSAAALSKAGGMLIEIPDWTHAINADEEEARKVVDLNARAWSALNAMIVDKGTTISNPSSGALAGTDDVLYALAWILCAQYGIPMSKLFGLQPSGFSSDITSERQWDRAIESGRAFIEPTILEVRRHTWAQVLGVAAWPAGLRVVWNPIKPPTTVERSEALTALAEALAALRDLGAVDQAGIVAAVGRCPEAEGIPLVAEAPVGAGLGGPEVDADGEILSDAEAEAVTGWATPQALAEELGLQSASSIRTLWRKGGIRARKVNGRLQYVRSDLEEALAGAELPDPSVDPIEGP